MNIQNFILFKIILEKLCVSLIYSLYHEEFVFFHKLFKSIAPGNLSSVLTASILLLSVVNIWKQKIFSIESMEICGVLCSIFFSESITKNNWMVAMEPQSHFFFISISVYVLFMCQMIAIWQVFIGTLTIPLPQFLQLYVASTVIKKFDDNHLTLCLWTLSVTYIMVPMPGSYAKTPSELHVRITSLLTAISARVIVRELNLYLVQYQDNNVLRVELLVAQFFFILFNIGNISEKTKFVNEILTLSCAQNLQTLLLKSTSSISFCFVTFWCLFVIFQCDYLRNANILNTIKYCIAFTTSLQVSNILDLLTSGYEKNTAMFLLIYFIKVCTIRVENYLKKKKYSMDKYQDKFVLINIVDWEGEKEDSALVLNSNLGLPGLN